MARFKTQWAVTAKIGTTEPRSRFAVAIRSDFRSACEAAKKYALNGWRGVQVDKLTTPKELADAENQCEKVEDWSTDHEITE